MDAKRERGVPLPSWYLDEPPTLPFTDQWMAHFWVLDTERYPAGSGLPGRIPESRIHDYGFRQGWPADMIALFTRVMLAVDRGYISWIHSEREKRTQAAQKATKRR